MKKISVLSVAVIGLALSLAVSQASAQAPVRQPAPAAGAGRVALLDVSYIFKNHARFKAMMDEMKNNVDAAERDVKAEDGRIQKLAEKMQDYRPGTPEYKQAESDIAKSRADLSIKVQLQRKDFLLQEAKIYHTVYQDIEKEVAFYCQNNGIDVVYRFNGDPADIEKPESVLSYINKPVVYYEKNRDITPFILDSLNRNGNMGTANRRAAPPTGGQGQYGMPPR